MSATIKYKGGTIASITTDSSKTLKTSGKYCEGDIVVENVQDGGATEPYIEETYDSYGDLTSVVMYGLPKIRDHAYHDCPGLASVTIPNSVTSIGDSAFYLCGSLPGVTIPDSVTTIGSSAFESCSSLASVTIPNSVTHVYDLAFGYCDSLTSVTFNGTPSLIDATAFEGSPKLTTINVPWAENAVANAPWGATSATINYNYTGA